MALHLVTAFLFSQILYVCSFNTLNRYHERLTREDPENSFHPLNQAQFMDDDLQFPDESSGESIRFMVAPVS
ncbi:unnamed protein product [Strongylus vulgaris]|uniref:Uncharacterized protein n=1 Tax=Strongylus vulgaris TaxID=40348 RepID=A0A3P7KCA9_STRVU|nr:unnamed protein product [Strongylus vulgaris]